MNKVRIDAADLRCLGQKRLQEGQQELNFTGKSRGVREEEIYI